MFACDVMKRSAAKDLFESSAAQKDCEQLLFAAFESNSLLRSANFQNVSFEAIADSDFTLLTSIFGLTRVFYLHPQFLLQSMQKLIANEELKAASQNVYSVLLGCMRHANVHIRTAVADFFAFLWHEPAMHAENWQVLRDIALLAAQKGIADEICTSNASPFADANEGGVVDPAAVRMLLHLAIILDASYWMAADQQSNSSVLVWILAQTKRSLETQCYAFSEICVELLMQLLNSSISQAVWDAAKGAEFVIFFLEKMAEMLIGAKSNVAANEALADCMAATIDAAALFAIHQPQHVLAALATNRQMTRAVVASLKEAPSDLKEAILSFALAAAEISDETALFGNSFIEEAGLKYLFPLFVKSKEDSLMKAQSLKMLAALATSSLTAENANRLWSKFGENSCEKLREVLRYAQTSPSVPEDACETVLKFVATFNEDPQVQALITEAAHGEKNVSSAD